MNHLNPRALRALVLFAALLPMERPCAGADPLTPDEAAAVLLDSANRAFNEQKHDFAVERFREFAKLYANHRDLPRAEYGMGLALLEGPRKDYAGAAQAFQSAAGRGEFSERAFTLYYLGVARRALGEQELALIVAKPTEAEQHRTAANQRLAEAAGSFAEASAAFLARVGTPIPVGERPAELDWAARARCDGTDLLLRLGRFKDAADAADAFLGNPALTPSLYSELAIYHQGYARFGLKDYAAAGRALSTLAPFEQPFGIHVRYLLGRIHHLADERPEATLQYRAALAGYDQRKKAAQTAMQNPAVLPPEKRAACEALLRDPVPEYLARATFYLALAACESDRFSEALDGFAAFIQQNPTSPYLAEAQLRQGFCRMQLGGFAEAIAILQTQTNQPARADRALWWLARCQARVADPKTPAAYGPALQGAADNVRRAADLAGQLAQTDPDAKIRRGEMLMDLAEMQVALKQYKEAADTYQRVLQENATPNRAEEALQRRVTALHLGGFYRESDDLAAQFEQTYPRSVLLPAVLFRRAENAYLVATAQATNTVATPNRAQELARLFGEAIARYQRLLDRYPDSSDLNAAREAMGTSYYRLGKFKEAVDALGGIPSEAYGAELAGVPYLLADSLIRCAPQDPADAMAAADLLGKVERAAKLLEGFVAQNDKSPQLPDALLKQGWCYGRMAEAARDPEEIKKALTSGKAAYERLTQQFAQDPAAPVAIFERAGCLAGLGDVANAIAELNRFQQDPLRSTPTAPLALARLAALLRAQNKAPDAVNALQQYRAQFEANLLKDPAQADKVPPLQYEQAMALKQAGKAAEARVLFDGLVKQFPDHPAAANAAWRATQSRREELAAQMEAARQATIRPGAKPEEIAAAQRGMGEALNGIRDSVSALQSRADALGKSAPGSPAQLCALYEIAWACRTLAGVETEAALRQMRQEAVEKLRAKLAQQLPPGQAPGAIREPEIALTDITPPLSERTAIDYYERLIAAAPGAPLAGQARLELAELHARRARYETAAQVLGAALSRQPPPEIVAQIRVQLAAAWLGQKKPKAALAQADIVASEAANPLAGYARYLMGEALFQQQEWNRVIERMIPFRDQGPLQNVPDVSDRALLRLGQAYQKMGQGDPCRQALSALAQRFPRSPWLDEALYTMGLSLQKQEQFDPAVEAYKQVTGRTASAWGAQAQLQIGLCRMAQKRPADALQALLAVVFTYDYPEWQAPAYCEAARACVELKQPEEAVRLLQKVTRDYASSPWAQAARDQLEALGVGQ